MPPKKRIARGTPTRRTPKSTPNSDASSTPASPSAVAVTGGEVGTPVAAPESETPSPSSALAVLPELTSSPTEVPASEPETTSTAMETEPVASAEEPAVEAESIASVEEAPKPEEEAPAEAKTTVKVRKVVKKKIIVKKVPKRSITATAAAAVPPKEESKPSLDGMDAETQLSELQSNAELENKPGTELDTESEPLEQEQKPVKESDASSVLIEENKLYEKEVPEVGNVELNKDINDNTMEQKKEAIIDDSRVELKDDTIDTEERGILERRWRRKTEIFIGGINRDAKEEDIRKVFGTVGDIVEVRIIMEGRTGKNKGYAFLKYSHPLMAKKAVKEFEKVEVCGKLCGAASLEGNDTIYLGNIDKEWKKDDVDKLLEETGIEKIVTVTVMADPQNSSLNRGYAFLELETNKDAEIAFKKLQKRDASGKGKNIKVAWAESFNDPDEEDLQQVKSVYVEDIPSSWDEKKLHETFKRFGEIERVVLPRNTESAKRKEFSFIYFTSRESALLCIKSFRDEELTENGSKVNINVSLAKPILKHQQSLGAQKSGNMVKSSEKPKPSQYTKVTYHSKGKSSASTVQAKPFSGSVRSNVSREPSIRSQGKLGFTRGPATQNYAYGLQGVKRTLSTMGNDAHYSDVRGYPRPRMDISYPVAGSSYDRYGVSGSSLPYYTRPGAGYQSGEIYGNNRSSSYETRGGHAYGSQYYPRY